MDSNHAPTYRDLISSIQTARSSFHAHLRFALVGSSGLEPPTSRLSGARSNHLSYEPVYHDCLSFGGDKRARTADPLLAKQVLSRLSYTPISSTDCRFLFFNTKNSAGQFLFRPHLKIKQRSTPALRLTLGFRVSCFHGKPRRSRDRSHCSLCVSQNRKEIFSWFLKSLRLLCFLLERSVLLFISLERR